MKAPTAGLPNPQAHIYALEDEFVPVVNALPADGEKQKGIYSPISVCLADVQPQSVDWFWPQRVARGKLTLLSGIPGLGKTFIGLDIMARASTGCRFPDCDSLAPLGSSIFLGMEDGLEDTIRPRLDAAGADVTKIHALKGVKYSDPDTGVEIEDSVDLTQHVEELEELVVRTGDVVTVVIDPLPGFLGNTDSHKCAEVRRALANVIALADKHKFALIGITHLTKDEAKAAINRTQGSIAFVAAARCVMAVVADKRDTTGQRRLLVPIKNNLGNDRTGLAYQLTTEFSNRVPAVVWDAETVDIRADEALSPDKPRGPEPEAQGEAGQFLRAALAGGPRPTKDIEAEAINGHDIRPAPVRPPARSVAVATMVQDKALV
jgi:hypothetical protein